MLPCNHRAVLASDVETEFLLLLVGHGCAEDIKAVVVSGIPAVGNSVARDDPGHEDVLSKAAGQGNGPFGGPRTTGHTATFCDF